MARETLRAIEKGTIVAAKCYGGRLAALRRTASRALNQRGSSGTPASGAAVRVPQHTAGNRANPPARYVFCSHDFSK